MPDRLDGLLPLVVRTLFGTSSAFGEVGVVNPSARTVRACREEQRRPVASVDHEGVDLCVSTRKQIHSVPHVGQPAFREQLDLGIEVEVPAIDGSETTWLQDPQRQPCQVFEQRNTGFVVGRIDYETVDGIVRHVGPYFAQIAES